MHGPIIAFEGPIGAGKTTATEAVSSELNLRPIYEPVGSNPYLDVFYEDPKRWAFPMQIELLHRRYALQKIAAYEATTACGFSGAVLDRSLPGDRVFARLHMLKGNMSKLEWETYERCCDTMVCSLLPPTVMVYLDVDPETAFERIVKRGRKAEAGIDIEYIRELRKGYLDLIVDIESGKHAWSRGMQVIRLPWNVDHQPLSELIGELRHRFRL